MFEKVKILIHSGPITCVLDSRLPPRYAKKKLMYAYKNAPKSQKVVAEILIEAIDRETYNEKV